MSYITWHINHTPFWQLPALSQSKSVITHVAFLSVTRLNKQRRWQPVFLQYIHLN